MADIAITAANVAESAGAVIENGRAGAAITAGQVLYKEAATGLFKLADANSATAEAKQAYGIALHGALTNQRIAVQTGGDIVAGGTLVAGSPYYLSGTPGGIAPAADLVTTWHIAALGYAVSTTVLRVHIQNTGVTL